MTKSFEEKALDILEQFGVRAALDTEEKVERYTKASKHGYSPEFALIFAVQNS